VKNLQDGFSPFYCPVKTFTPVWIHPAGRLGQGRKKSCFRPTQIFLWFVEIDPGCVDDTPDPVPIGSDAEVVSQDFFPAMPGSEKHRSDHFQSFPEISSISGTLEPGHLHGNGGSSGDSFTVFQVLEKSPADRSYIHSRMMVEPVVLDPDGGSSSPFREFIRNQESPLIMGGIRQFR